jgi:ketosteroid isomerase-like protein
MVDGLLRIDMNEAGNLAVVEEGYSLLERDDVAGFLELCAADAEWLYPAEGKLPYGGTWRGRDAVAAFFDAHDAAEEILELRFDDFLVQADRVVALGLFRGRAKPNGAVWETRFVHVITLYDGRWRRFEAYFDTATALEAHHAIR